MKPIQIVAICVICAAILMSGCVDQAEPNSRRLTTHHVSGIDQRVVVNDCSTLHMSGVDNVVQVTNDDVRRIYVSGVDNTVYIPSSSNPTVSQSGIGCVVIRR